MNEHKKRKIRIVCVSDTHNRGPPSGFQLPKGDILVHAGDLTNQGSYAEIERAVGWLREADFAVKVVVAGNHDLSLDPSYAPDPTRGWNVAPEDHERCRKLLDNIPGLVYLQHSSATIHLLHPPDSDNEDEESTTLRIFGSPYSQLSPEKNQNWAFQYPAADTGANATDAEAEGEGIWSSILTETDILITHTPPLGHCDRSAHWKRGGCPSLLKAMGRVKPALHICGHCHEGRGAQVVRWKAATADVGEKGESAKGVEEEGEVESVRTWEDPGAGSKKQSLLDLTGLKGGQRWERGRETAVVNASIMGKSWEKKGVKVVNKPIIVGVIL